MFERFTDGARRVIVLAQEEARELNHNYIGTEHILLGLVHEGSGPAGAALDLLGVTLEGARAGVVSIVSRGPGQPSGHIPFTPRSKKVLELSLREAMDLGHTYIGPEHILLGLIREGEGVATHVLQNLGVSADRLRDTVLGLISEAPGSEAGGGAEAGGRWEAGGGVAAMGPEVRVVGSPGQIAEILNRLRSIDGRLAAIERHLGLAARPAGEPEPPAEPGPPEEPGPAAEAGPQAG
jgi:ATP-dependent Clp protease ATP-binding subunit ClpC